MKVALLFVALCAMPLVTSCARQPTLLADASDVVAEARATDADTGFIEMPPLYVDASTQYRLQVEQASADAIEAHVRRTRCPRVRTLRTDIYRRADGTPWTVVRLHACGEERVYEKTLHGWREATARLR